MKLMTTILPLITSSSQFNGRQFWSITGPLGKWFAPHRLVGLWDVVCAVVPGCAWESAALLTSAVRTLSSDAGATAVPGRGESDCVRNAGHNIATAVEIATIATTAVADNSRADKSGRFICFSRNLKTEGHLAISTGRASRAGPGARLSSDAIDPRPDVEGKCHLAVLRNGHAAGGAPKDVLRRPVGATCDPIRY